MTPPLSCVATLLLSPPAVRSPQVTTELCSFNAAKAYRVENTWLMPLLSSMPALLLTPPYAASPYVTTEPSCFSAAKARKFLSSETDACG